ncbi:unnamed protein product [Amoebophrya sp. A120]|nr:unnamed protein product [Amoebophrya sp. A120]|eukprot:GSA120T00025757001.1
MFPSKSRNSASASSSSSSSNRYPTLLSSAGERVLLAGPSATSTTKLDPQEHRGGCSRTANDVNKVARIPSCSCCCSCDSSLPLDQLQHLLLTEEMFLERGSTSPEQHSRSCCADHDATPTCLFAPLTLDRIKTPPEILALQMENQHNNAAPDGFSSTPSSSLSSSSAHFEQAKRVDVFSLLPNHFQHAQRNRQRRLTDTNYFQESARFVPGRKKTNRNAFEPAIIAPKSPKERSGARSVREHHELALDFAGKKTKPKLYLPPEEKEELDNSVLSPRGTTARLQQKMSKQETSLQTTRTVLETTANIDLGTSTASAAALTDTMRRTNTTATDLSTKELRSIMDELIMPTERQKSTAQLEIDSDEDQLYTSDEEFNSLKPKQKENKPGAGPTSRNKKILNAKSGKRPRSSSPPVSTTSRTSSPPGLQQAGQVSVQAGGITFIQRSENEQFDDFAAEVDEDDYDSDLYSESQDGLSSLNAFSPEERIKFLQTSTDEELLEKGVFRLRKVTVVSDRATELRSREAVEEEGRDRARKGRTKLMSIAENDTEHDLLVQKKYSEPARGHSRSVFDTYMDDSDESSEDESASKPKVSKFDGRSSQEKQRTRVEEMARRAEAGAGRHGPFQLTNDVSPLSRFGNLAVPGDFLILEDVPGIAKLWFSTPDTRSVGNTDPKLSQFRSPSTIVTNAALFPLKDRQFNRPPPGAREDLDVEATEYTLGLDGDDEVILVDVPDPDTMNLVVPRAVRDPHEFSLEVNSNQAPRKQILLARMVEDRRRLETSLKQTIVMRKGQVDAISKLFARDGQKATRACGPFCFPRYSEYKPAHGMGLPVVEMMPVFEDRRNRFYHVRRVLRPARINMIRSAQQKEIDRVLLEQKKAADLAKKGGGLFGMKKNLLRDMLKKDGGLMDQVRSSILVVDHKSVHHKPPYHLLYSLKQHAESWKKFGLDWCYGILNDLTSDAALGNFLWEVNWMGMDQSARMFKASVGAEAKRLSENKELLLNMFTTVPDGVIREMIKKKREMLGKETNVENELLQADVERIRKEMLQKQGVDPRKATESKIMENHRHHETELRDMPLRHVPQYICAVRDISQACEIRQAYPPSHPRYANISRLYCVGCRKIILRLGERTTFFYCHKCMERGSQPYCLCSNCNDQFRMSLMAYKLLEDTAEAEKERMAADLLASMEQDDEDSNAKKATAALFGS